MCNADSLAPQLTSKPTRKKRRNQTQQIIENRNRLGDNPRQDPDCESNSHPGSCGDQIARVHAIAVAEETDVDVFTGDVAVDYTGGDDLFCVRIG